MAKNKSKSFCILFIVFIWKTSAFGNYYYDYDFNYNPPNDYYYEPITVESHNEEQKCGDWGSKCFRKNGIDECCPEWSCFIFKGETEGYCNYKDWEDWFHHNLNKSRKSTAKPFMN